MTKLPRALVLGAIGALLLFAATPARAQSIDPCEPDCHETPFEGAFYHTTFLSSRNAAGAWCFNEYQIAFYSRKGACGQFNDVQITSIRLTGVPSPECATAYNNLPDLFKGAVRAIIRDNPMHFQPDWTDDKQWPAAGDPSICSTHWRVSAGVCWRMATPPEYGVRPCDPLCCVQSFQVCVNSGGSVSFSPVGTPNGGGMCPSTFGPECTPVCEYLHAVGELPDGGNAPGTGDGPALSGTAVPATPR
jgi:hypothetical protein